MQGLQSYHIRAFEYMKSFQNISRYVKQVTVPCIHCRTALSKLGLLLNPEKSQPKSNFHWHFKPRHHKKAHSTLS